MEPVKLLLLGLVIGSNNLAAALALGALGQAKRGRRIMAVFGAFEFIIPLAGITIGKATSRWVERHAGWVGVALLVAIGLWMVWGAVRHRSSDEKLARRITTWRGLILLAAGLSLDNLVIGFSLGLGGTEPLILASTICAFSVAFTWLGLRLGDASRRHWERIAEFGAGVLLLGLAAANGAGWV